MYGKELHGKTIQRQATGYLLHWRPAELSKQRLSISKICDVSLIEHVLAMLKEFKELRQRAKVQFSVDKG